jgi:HEAT repeat protein
MAYSPIKEGKRIMLEGLVEKLKAEKNIEEKLKIIQKINFLGNLAKPAISNLITLLNPKEPSVYIALVTVLANLKEISILPVLITIATDEKENLSFRKKIIAILPKFKDPSVIPTLSSLLENNKAIICNEAVKAIVKFKKYPNLVSALCDALNTSKPLVQKNILKNLIKLDDPSSIPALIELIKEGDLKTIDKILQLLNSKGTKLVAAFVVYKDPTLLKALFTAIENNSKIRAYYYNSSNPSAPNYNEISEILTKFPKETVVPKLLEMLQHPDKNVRLNTVKMLAHFNSESISSILIDSFDDTSLDVRYAIIEVLKSAPFSISKTQETKLIDEMIVCIQKGKEENHSVTYYLMDIINKVESDSFKEAFIEKLVNLIPSNTEYSEEILEILFKFKTNEIAPAFNSVLKNSSAKSKEQIIEFLNRAKELPSIFDLIKSLDLQKENPFKKQMEELEKVKETNTIPNLIKKLKKSNSETCHEFIEALAKFADEKAVDTLYNAMLTGKYEYNPFYILRLLSENPSKESGSAIMRALKDKKQEVREAATQYIYNLKDFTENELIEALIERQEDPEYKVRDAARMELAKFNIPTDIDSPYTTQILVSKLIYDYQNLSSNIDLMAKYKNKEEVLGILLCELIKLDGIALYSSASMTISYRVCQILNKNKNIIKELVKPTVSECITRLVDLLKADSTISLAIIPILGAFREVNHTLITKALQDKLESQDYFVRISVIKTLTKFKDKNLIPSFLKIAEQETNKVFLRYALLGLKALGWVPL